VFPPFVLRMIVRCMLCFCEKYGNLARTDLKNEQISQ
jgi:hypothetical protein